jgi:hypothetical protein
VSFLFPCAPKNSAGQSPAPFDTLSWLDRNRTLKPADTPVQIAPLWREFFQWKRIKEDMLHFTPFDSLPQEQRDAIRARRLLAFQESHIPWQVSDLSTFLTAVDDIDDMGKSVRFVKDYAITPVRRLFGPKGPRIDGDLDDNLVKFRDSCRLRADARAAKLALVNAIQHKWSTGIGAAALALLFPAWKFAALGMQFLQTLDGFFGVGLQLGPFMGLLAETAFRGAELVGAPFSPSDNKYNQILAARVTAKSPLLIAAHNTLHPEDLMTTYIGMYHASETDVLPYVFISPDDYPSAIDVFSHPITQLQHFVGMLDSIPYNFTASLINNFMAPTLDNWSGALGNAPSRDEPRHIPNSLERRLIGLAEHQICPSANCNAAIWQHLGIENNAAQRFDPITHQLRDAIDFFGRLLWSVPAKTAG